MGFFLSPPVSLVAGKIARSTSRADVRDRTDVILFDVRDFTLFEEHRGRSVFS